MRFGQPRPRHDHGGTGSGPAFSAPPGTRQDGGILRPLAKAKRRPHAREEKAGGRPAGGRPPDPRSRPATWGV